MILKEYYDSYYGKVKIISILEFEREFYPLHKDCTMDSETIIHENELHIERFLCYNHKIDWFVQITILVLERWKKSE